MSDGDGVKLPGVDAALAESLAKIEIPPRPAILDHVMAEMQADEPDYRRLSSLITSDVGLAAWLVKTANAPIFGFRMKATTVRDALMRLGLLMVLRTVAAYGVRQALPENPALAGFWDTSARVAHLCAWLARELGIKEGVRAEDAYTYGLFRDCGIAVLMRVNPDYAATLAQATGEPVKAFTEVESERLGLNHAMVGSIMARSWYLPEPMCEAILFHHELTASPLVGLSRAGYRLAALAQLAEWLQGRHSLAVEREWKKQGGAVLSRLELTPERVEALQSGATDVLAQME
ncbi:MAG TPA: HDOD domain-containing protein [Aromatoleum sp.]|uniref:HDOD domain-containing protein n=1 Tax=Aromatoleum sp. TaxID=2307007 RepID=UPI002B45F5B9|nr:HDOD domain-containing protein [Aromatoleum sp.]HJV25247.1 HDOD domain-containing protein [Aromatoleum sp.]